MNPDKGSRFKLAERWENTGWSNHANTMKCYVAGLLLLTGCSTAEKTSVSAEAVPLFPVCVAEEPGGSRERHYTRLYVGLQESSD
jgi:hypothetical protein